MIKDSRIYWVRHKPDPGAVARMGDNLKIGEVVHQKRKIGAFLKGAEVNHALTPDEEAAYLPSIVGVQPNQQEWVSAVNQYWNNISTVVPYIEDANGKEVGLQLECGMYYKTDADLTAAREEEKKEWETYKLHRDEGRFYNMKFEIRFKLGSPINLNDYILFRHCLQYNRVANSPDEMYNSPNITFYLFSKDMEGIENQRLLKIKKEAMVKYLELMEDEVKMRDVVSVLNDILKTDPLPVTYNSSKGDIEVALDVHMNKSPATFLMVVKDESIQMKSLISRAINNGLLRRLPATDVIYYGDNTLIGNSVDEAVVFLTNDKNKVILQEIKSKLLLMK